MTSLCNDIILLFEFILQRFMADSQIVWKKFIAVGGTMRSYRLGEKVKMLMNHHFDTKLYKRSEYTVI